MMTFSTTEMNRKALVLFGAALMFASSACRKQEQYFESVVQVTRVEVLEEDEHGKPLQAEVELRVGSVPWRSVSGGSRQRRFRGVYEAVPAR
ncbi:MAG: hypothetical protein U0165_19225 [Polyangiaceae bacterium]